MRRLRSFLRDVRGSSALEFALVAPPFILFLIGIAQLGTVFLANAGLNNAVAQGARYATIYHVDYDGTNFEDAIEGELENKIEAGEFGLSSVNTTTVGIDDGVTPGGSSYVDVTMTHTIPLNFILFEKNVVLTQTRRAFIQAIPENNPV